MTYFIYVIYLKKVLEPLFDKKHGMIDPEDRLPAGMVGAIFIPICLVRITAEVASDGVVQHLTFYNGDLIINPHLSFHSGGHQPRVYTGSSLSSCHPSSVSERSFCSHQCSIFW